MSFFLFILGSLFLFGAFPISIILLVLNIVTKKKFLKDIPLVIGSFVIGIGIMVLSALVGA